MIIVEVMIYLAYIYNFFGVRKWGWKMNRGFIKTVRGYALDQVVSAIQKGIRRADFKVAGYFAIELYESNYKEYVWKRLRVIAAEDIYEAVSHEIEALYQAWAHTTNKGKKQGEGKIFIAKAVMLLCNAIKSRDACHLCVLGYKERKGISDSALQVALDEVRDEVVDMPDAAIDMHTFEGRRRRKGQTKEQMVLDFVIKEYNALSPRTPGVFDDIVEVMQNGR